MQTAKSLKLPYYQSMLHKLKFANLELQTICLRSSRSLMAKQSRPNKNWTITQSLANRFRQGEGLGSSNEDLYHSRLVLLKMQLSPCWFQSEHFSPTQQVMLKTVTLNLSLRHCHCQLIQWLLGLQNDLWFKFSFQPVPKQNFVIWAILYASPLSIVLEPCPNCIYYYSISDWPYFALTLNSNLLELGLNHSLNSLSIRYTVSDLQKNNKKSLLLCWLYAHLLKFVNTAYTCFVYSHFACLLIPRRHVPDSSPSRQIVPCLRSSSFGIWHSLVVW